MSDAEADPVLFAKALLAANQARNEILSEIAFADAVWVILLDLFGSQATDGRLSLSDIYTSMNVPKATTLRTIGRLVNQGHLKSAVDPRDGRRTLVWLSDHTHRQVSSAVDEMRAILAARASDPEQNT